MHSVRINDGVIIDTYGNEVIEFKSDLLKHKYNDMFVEILNEIENSDNYVFGLEDLVKSYTKVHIFSNDMDVDVDSLDLDYTLTYKK